MQQLLNMKVLPQEAADTQRITQLIAAEAGVKVSAVTGYYIRRQSIDARSKTVWMNLQVQAYINEPFLERPALHIQHHDVRHADKRMVIVGAGPAGLFAAMCCLEHGIKPIVLERGKDVRSRRRDLAAMNKQGEVNAESNYCFGERCRCRHLQRW